MAHQPTPPADNANSPKTTAPKPTPAPSADWDDEDDDRPYGDPSKVANEGPLKSLGKAITAPVREAGKPDATDTIEPSNPSDRMGPR